MLDIEHQILCWQCLGFLKLLETFAREKMKCMSNNYTKFKFSQIKVHPCHKLFHKRMSLEAVVLLLKFVANFVKFMMHSFRAMHAPIL